MEVIPSFLIDHTNLKPGIYISRQDKVGETEMFTTYDIRMTEPNKEPAIAPSALHTIEHLIATYLRNKEGWKDKVIYWGPMGCLTGNYLILKGEYDPSVIRELMLEAFDFVANFQGEVPGTTPETCGNYLLHDLPMAKWEAKRYIGRLKNDFHCEYAQFQRPETDGMVFHDA